MPIGSLLNLNVQFTHGGKQHWLACEGKVVRVTQADGSNGVAAQLLTPFFETTQEELVAQPAARSRLFQSFGIRTVALIIRLPDSTNSSDSR